MKKVSTFILVLMALTACGSNGGRKSGWNDQNVAQLTSSCSSATTSGNPSVSATSIQSACGCLVTQVATTWSLSDLQNLSGSSAQTVLNQLQTMINTCSKQNNIDPSVISGSIFETEAEQEQ